MTKMMFKINKNRAEEHKKNSNSGYFKRVWGTKLEGEAVQKIMSGRGYSASNMALDHLIENSFANLLHIATHGFLILQEDDSNGFNGIYFQDGKIICKELPDLLMGCGLAFAGANCCLDQDNKNDYNDCGIVTGYDVSMLNLNNIKLVVLSGCGTGIGYLNNFREVIGLPWAFCSAGAKSVIFSLWDVNDSVTCELMVLFYEALKRKNNIYKSLCFAKRQIKEKYAHPYYWAGWQLVGNTE